MTTSEYRPFSLRRRAVLGGSAALGAGLLVNPWAFAQDAPEGKPGGVLRVSMFTNPSSLDPMTSVAGSDINFLFCLYDTLIEYHPKTLEPMPGLAESWDFSDPQKLILNLRTDVVFHDSTPLDGAAVKAFLERNMQSDRSRVKPDVASIDTVEAPSSHQVVLNLKYPDAALLLGLSERAGMVFSPTAFEASGEDSDRNPVGTGPWKLVSWTDQDRVIVTRNEAYYKPNRPYLDGIDFQIIPDGGTGLRSVQSGQNDMVVGVSPIQIERLQNDPGLNIDIGDTLRALTFFIHYGRPPLDDVRLRQALNYAVDRQTFLDALQGGHGKVAGLIVPDGYWAYDEEAANRYPYDPEKAKQLVAEAGYPDGITLRVTVTADQTSLQQIEVFAEMFKKANINLEILSGSNNEIAERWRGGAADIHWALWSGRPDPSISYSSLYLKDSFFNVGKAEPSPELSQAIADTIASADPAVRAEAFQRANRLEREVALVVPVVFEVAVAAFVPKVKGYVSNLLNRTKYNDIYIDE